MRRVVLTALSVVLIIVLILTAQPLSVVFAESNSETFAENPLFVKPITEWKSDPVSNQSHQEVVSPLDWSAANGLKLTAATEYTNDFPASSLAFARYKTDGEFVLGNATHIIMYVKTDYANTILPEIAYSGEYINTSYDPIMALGVGKPYSYLSIRGDEWIETNTVATWRNSSGDINGDGISDIYFGGLEFYEAFEGYVKFAVADLMNDSLRIHNLDRATTKIAFFNMSVSKLGGRYGSVMAGPIFTTDSDTDSASILTPEVEVLPFEKYSVERAGAFGNRVYPLQNSDLSGETMIRNLAWDVPITQFATISSTRLQYTNIKQSMKGTEGLLFYCSVPAKTAVTFIAVLEDPQDPTRWKYSYAASLFPIANQDYFFLPEGDSVWCSAKLAFTNENGSKYRAAMYFETDFAGYIKIPYSSLANDSGFRFQAELDVLDSLMFLFSRFGGAYGEIVQGPNFFVTNDGVNQDIIIREEFPNLAFQADAYAMNKGIDIGSIERNTVVNSELKIKGASINHTTLLAYQTNEEVGQQSRRFLSFNYHQEPLKDSEGLLLYVKLPGENLMTLHAGLQDPGDTSRWRWSYAPSLSLYEGKSCFVLPLGETQWQRKTVVKASGNSFSGGISFDAGFEGYVKIPYSALRNDSGFVFSAEQDRLNDIALRFKRIGGSYGSVAVSYPYLLGRDSSSEKVSLLTKGEIHIAEMEYGVVSVDKGAAYPGEEVMLTVTPDEGYTLKTDGLFIEYSDHLGYKKKLVSNYKKNANAFSFTMPTTTALILHGEFVPIEERNFTLLDSTVVEERALQFTFREFHNFFSNEEKGVLIALEDSLGGNPLTADGNADCICITLSGADDEFTLGENKTYSDYRVCLRNIKNENLGRTLVVRGYQKTGNVYTYTAPVSVNYADMNGRMAEYENLPGLQIKNKSWQLNCSAAESPVEELALTDGIVAESSTPCHYFLSNLQNSSDWFTVGFSPVVVSDFCTLGIYVKVPETEENMLYLQFGDTAGNFYHIPAAKEYFLIEKATGKKEYKKTVEGIDRNAGILTLPAGFEGLVCVPTAILNPHSLIKAQTKLTDMTVRFSAIGSGAQAVTIGPIAGFKQQDRAILNSEITPEIPSGSAFSIDVAATEMKDDCAILYWDSTLGAENYIVKAYQRVIGGYSCVAENVLFSNSGSINGLENGKEYQLALCARDRRDNVLAQYVSTKLMFNPSHGYTDITQEEMNYDTVDYTTGNTENSLFVNRRYTTLNAYYSDLLSDNPNRGFRGCIDFFHFHLTDEDVEVEIEKDIRVLKNNGYHANVYVCYFYPGDYLGTDLSSNFFETAQKIFDYFRENKMQILLRFAYYDVNNFNVRTPTTEEILHHIHQLAENGIIERNQDVLHAFQVGFAGKFGEWHSDTPIETRANRSDVLNAFVENLLPDGIYAQLRMPNFKNFLSAENAILYGNRFGFHLDSFYGIMDGTEVGSNVYSYGCSDWERHIAEACTVPNDAEVYYWSQFDDIGYYPDGYASVLAASQLRLTTLSAINGYLDQNVHASGCFNEWKKVPITENWLAYNHLPVTEGWLTDNNAKRVNRNVFEYIRDYLGYRITAKELSVTESQKGMNISLSLMNYGFSAAFNISSNFVILDSQNREVYSIRAGNPEEWYGTMTGTVPDGNLLTHHLSVDMPIPSVGGDYKIALQLVSKSGATARLDNKIPYVDGYNILHTFRVTD